MVKSMNEFIRLIKKDIEEKNKDIIKKKSEDIVEEILNITPIDTGDLRDSIYAKSDTFLVERQSKGEPIGIQKEKAKSSGELKYKLIKKNFKLEVGIDNSLVKNDNGKIEKPEQYGSYYEDNGPPPDGFQETKAKAPFIITGIIKGLDK